METGKYVFNLSPYDAKALAPLVSASLEKMAKVSSREKLPGLWKAIDALGGPKPRPQASPRTRPLSIVCLALGVFLFVPGLTDPQGLLVPLLAGAVGVGAGIGGLTRSRRAKGSPFDRAATTLIENVNKAVEADESVTVAFDENGMTIAAGADTERIPYESFEHASETADTLLLVFDERVMVLQKSDLAGGGVDGFRSLVSGKISRYQTIV